MFTGIIQAIGHIVDSEFINGDQKLHISSETLDFSDVQPGDSIAVSGVCLTVLEIKNNGFAVDVSCETLSCTTLGMLTKGGIVNLEKSLRLIDRLGGHLVSGHVDGIGTVLSISEDGRSQRWTFEVPSSLMRYIAPKGSICIDGVSLTVNEVKGNSFGVNLIPHTLQHTTFGQQKSGNKVNLEMDLVARYVERMLRTYP